MCSACCKMFAHVYLSEIFIPYLMSMNYYSVLQISRFSDIFKFTVSTLYNVYLTFCVVAHTLFDLKRVTT